MRIIDFQYFQFLIVDSRYFKATGKSKTKSKAEETPEGKDGRKLKSEKN